MKNKIDAIKNKIKKTALKYQRDLNLIHLVTVSKTMSREKVKLAIDAGAAILGESYINEAREKTDALKAYNVSWHFIGHLQSNKAKHAVGLFDLIHSVDSMKLVKEIDKQAKKKKIIQNILIQVNISNETTKSGIELISAEDFLKEAALFKNISIKGLMTIPPFFDDQEKARPFFKALRQLKETINLKKIPYITLTELSMGMTNDYEVAIEEGATYVRIGTAIFGQRT